MNKQPQRITVLWLRLRVGHGCVQLCCSLLAAAQETDTASDAAAVAHVRVDHLKGFTKQTGIWELLCSFPHCNAKLSRLEAHEFYPLYWAEKMQLFELI